MLEQSGTSFPAWILVEEPAKSTEKEANKIGQKSGYVFRSLEKEK